jgi:hypothetical protein
MAQDKRIQSIFGKYSQKLQVIIDKRKDKFAPTWFQKYFPFANPTIDLTYITAVGRSRIEAAASVVDRDSDAPLRGRPSLEKYSGEIPAIKQAFKLKESDVRTWLSLQNMNVLGGSAVNQILDLIWGDTKKSGDAAMKKIDLMCLEAVSKAKISINATNNPDGVVYDEIDLLLPADQKDTVTTTWDNDETAKPIDNIHNVIRTMQAKGIVFDKMLMSMPVFWAYQATNQVKEYLYGVDYKGVPTLEQLNRYLTENKMPVIELVNEAIGIEKNGKISTVRPFDETVVSFVPAGDLGVIHNSYSIEQLRPVDGISYATYNKALISKWSQAHPFGEFTQVEINAFPGLEVVDSMYLLTVL